MPHSFGDFNAELTKAVRRISQVSGQIRFADHAVEEMENDDFDHEDVLLGLRKGSVYGPEIQGRGGRLRANVVHRGIHIRISIGGLDGVGEDWTKLMRLTVVTVMRMI